MILFLAQVSSRPVTSEETIVIAILAVVAIALLAFGLIRFRRSRRRSSAEWYVGALRELVRGDQEGALRHLKMVVARDSGNIDAYLRLGDILRDRGEVNRALQLHRQLTVRSDLGADDRKDLLKSLALDYLDIGRSDRAIATLEELLSIDRKNIWALEQLVQLHENQGRWEQAFSVREHIFKITDQRDDALLALYEVHMGYQLISQKQYHKARLKYKDAIRRDRHCVAAYLGLGDAYQEEGRLDEAVESWKQLLGAVPQRAYLAFERLEKTLFDQGKFGEMATLYRELLEKDTDNTKALMALARIQEKKGDIQDALETCQRVLQIQPDDLAARQLMIRIYEQMDAPEKIAAVLQEMVIQSPDEFVCQNCGYRSKKPLWRCPHCQRWRTFDL
jgi:lipopolysaccharide biosynthesis regulator YciM